MKKLVTTLGNKSIDQVGLILPHEHVFVDLRTCDQEGYGQAETSDVVQIMTPYLQDAKRAGIDLIIDCGPIGVGRRVDILKAVSIAAKYPLVVPTGVYREPWIPGWVHEADEAFLERWMTKELNEGIEGTCIKAGFVKVSASDDGMTACEAKILRAACSSAKTVEALIGSHTVAGKVVCNQLDLIEKAGYRTNRFLWIHTHIEPDFELHLEMAKRGAWIEYDNIGWGTDEFYMELILKIL
ncbi:MAG: esterase, partial [Vallitaleaceae bacterium]|nr:esterase [Vallitaleaceae bacterium]